MRVDLFEIVMVFTASLPARCQYSTLIDEGNIGLSYKDLDMMVRYYWYKVKKKFLLMKMPIGVTMQQSETQTFIVH